VSKLWAVLSFLVGCVFVAVGGGMLVGGDPAGGTVVVLGLVCYAVAALVGRSE
jgi:hypothetical protein